MLLLFSIGIAECLEKSCFFLVYHVYLLRTVVYLFPFSFEGWDVGSESEKDSSISLPCLSSTNASFYIIYTSFPFGFGARLWGLIVT